MTSWRYGETPGAERGPSAEQPEGQRPQQELEDRLQRMTVEYLRAELRHLGAKRNGCKQELVRRLLCWHDALATQGTVQIFVEPLTGPQIALDVRPLDSVDTVRMAIHRKEGTPPDRQLLSFDGKRLEDGHTLLSCDAGRGSTLCLGGWLRGGSQPGPEAGWLSREDREGYGYGEPS